MRLAKTRVSDSTFDINLAPFLDIIVSVVPLLLLSVVFVEIKMIETPVPQVVQQIMEEEKKNPDPDVTLTLRVAKKKGFTFEVLQQGKTEEFVIPPKDGILDYESLKFKAANIKRRFPKTFKLGLAPDADVAFNDLVRSMDTVRKAPETASKISVTDPSTGQVVETDLMFPNVTFANVVGE